MELPTMRTKKSWREKLADSKDLPRVAEITPRHIPSWGAGTFIIPAPIEVDAIMKRVPRGKLVTIDVIRQALARRHHTTNTCPLTTGIFAWISAHAADEAEREGKKRITPYWRTLKSRGELNPKYPGGLANLKARLEAEGHTLIQKGKRVFAKDFEHALLGAEAIG
jgi:hypothetical protein